MTFQVIEETAGYGLVKATEKKFAGLLNKHTYMVQSARTQVVDGNFIDVYTDLYTGTDLEEAKRVFDSVTFSDSGFGMF